MAKKQKPTYSLPVRILAIALTVLLASGAAVSILAGVLEMFTHTH